MEPKRLSTSQLFSLVFCTLGVTFIFIGVVYGYLSDFASHSVDTVPMASFEVSYDVPKGQGDTIQLPTNIPLSDEEGLKTDYYQFTIKNTTSSTKKYRVRLVSDASMIRADGCEGNQVPLPYIRYNVNDGTPLYLREVARTDYTISSGELAPYERRTYQVHLWISSEASQALTVTEHFHGQIIIEEVA